VPSSFIPNPGPSADPVAIVGLRHHGTTPDLQLVVGDDAQHLLRCGQAVALLLADDPHRGSGKTTTGRAILRLLEPAGGSIWFEGTDITHVDNAALRPRMQMIFQDPYSSLKPRRKVRDIIEEAFVIHGIGARRDRHERAVELLDRGGNRVVVMYLGRVMEVAPTEVIYRWPQAPLHDGTAGGGAGARSDGPTTVRRAAW
jgi:hypothetical protein